MACGSPAPTADAGHPDAGEGIVDAGQRAWRKVDIGQTLVVDPPPFWGGGAELYLGAASGVVLHSLDDGRSWKPQKVGARAVTAFAGSPTGEVIAVMDRDGLYHTSDHALTWQAMSPAPVGFFGDGSGASVLGAVVDVNDTTDTVFHSKDDGATWTVLTAPTVPVGQGASLQRGAVFRQPGALFVGGTNGLRRLDDAGNWSLQGEGNINQLWGDGAGHLASRRQVDVVTTLWVSDDVGVTWHERTPPGVTRFVGVPTTGAFWLVAGDGVAWRSADAGHTWVAQTPAPPADLDVWGGWVTSAGSVVVVDSVSGSVWRWGEP